MLIGLLRDHLRGYRRPLVFLGLLQLAQALAALYLPTLNADVIDKGVIRGDTGYILKTGVIMLGIALVQIACTIGAVYFGARTAMAVGRDLRAAVFTKVQSFSSREIRRFGAPSLITRTTNDVQQVQTLAQLTFTILIPAPIICIGGIALALRQDVPLSSLMLIIVPLLVGVVLLVTRRMRPLFRQMQERIDTVNRVLREQIAGIRVIRAFVRDAHERRRFAAANADLTEVGLSSGRLMALISPAILAVINVSSVAVIWFGGHRVAHGMQIGAMTAFLSYLMQVLVAVMMATFMFAMVPRAEVSAERIHEVLATEPSLTLLAMPVTEIPRRGVLELRGVSFRYPGAQDAVLHDIRLECLPGTTTALIGGTGSGKTTLLHLIPRLDDATDGAILIDGVDVRDLDPAVLASVVGLVPQNPYLFTGTVATNLRYGEPDASDEELWHALDVAQARDFVTAMPGGLNAPIAQGGANVSGGQRQRIAIARMLVAKPRICLFDDAFSALDQATDAALRTALAPELADATVIVVAQRVRTIRDAEQIVVLDEGRVSGTGTHHDLLAGDATYREIVRSQLTEAEAIA